MDVARTEFECLLLISHCTTCAMLLVAFLPRLLAPRATAAWAVPNCLWRALPPIGKFDLACLRCHVSVSKEKLTGHRHPGSFASKKGLVSRVVSACFSRGEGFFLAWLVKLPVRKVAAAPPAAGFRRVARARTQMVPILLCTLDPTLQIALPRRAWSQPEHSTMSVLGPLCFEKMRGK